MSCEYVMLKLVRIYIYLDFVILKALICCLSIVNLKIAGFEVWHFIFGYFLWLKSLTKTAYLSKFIPFNFRLTIWELYQ